MASAPTHPSPPSSSSKTTRQLNDVANAINNTSKRCVRGPDSSLYVLDQEGGVTGEGVNGMGRRFQALLRDSVFEGDRTLPTVMSAKFRKDMMLDLFRHTVLDTPAGTDRYDDDEGGGGPGGGGRGLLRDPRITLARAVVPGLPSLKSALLALLAREGIALPSAQTVTNLFTRVCPDSRCLRNLYRLEDTGLPPPPLCVQHPAWFYYPEDSDGGDELAYVRAAAAYITEFEREPCSFECALCATYHRLADDTMCNDDSSATLNLASAPDEFRINTTVLDMYSMHGIPVEEFDFGGLRFCRDAGPDGVERYHVSYNGMLFL